MQQLSKYDKNSVSTNHLNFTQISVLYVNKFNLDRIKKMPDNFDCWIWEGNNLDLGSELHGIDFWN